MRGTTDLCPFVGPDSLKVLFLIFLVPTAVLVGIKEERKGKEKHVQNQGLRWQKSTGIRPGNSADFEEKYEPGTELKNGRVVLPRRPDSLAARAAEAEAKWIEERAAGR
jgi:hypothetical protein